MSETLELPGIGQAAEDDWANRPLLLRGAGWELVAKLASMAHRGGAVSVELGRNERGQLEIVWSTDWFPARSA